ESRVEIGQRTASDRFDGLRLHKAKTPLRRQRGGNACVLRRRDHGHFANSAKAAHARASPCVARNPAPASALGISSPRPPPRQAAAALAARPPAVRPTASAYLR